MNENITYIAGKARAIRVEVLKMTHGVKSGHTGSALGVADMLAALYFNILRIDPENPDFPDRDRMILSKGHACPALYAALALRGFFPLSELANLRRLGGALQGHPDVRKTPGVDITTGSLGQGLSLGVGMALAGRLNRKDYRVFVLMGDGELNEGVVWEAAMAASKFRLSNLIGVVERNNLQIDGATETIMPLEPLADKWRAFNWSVCETDGNNVESFINTMQRVAGNMARPAVIIAKTVKGRGVSFMENQCGWHGKAPDDREFETAMKELGEPS